MPIAARADFKLWRRSHGLMKGQEWLQMSGNCQLSYQDSEIMWQFEFLTFMRRCVRAQRARGHVRTGNFETLKMTWLVYSKLLKIDFEHFLILKRAHVRVTDAHGNVDCYLLDNCLKLCVQNLVNLWWMVMKIWMMKWNHKWRLDDVMVGWSDWKGYSIHSWSGQRYCENLNMIVASVFEISSKQNSYRKK